MSDVGGAVDELADARTHPVTDYDRDDVGATGAREAVVELARDLADDTDVPRRRFLLHEDAMENGHYSLRVVTPAGTIPADLALAAGRQGFALTYLGEQETAPTSHVWLVETDGDVHGRVY